MAKVCVGCEHHIVTTRYVTRLQSLYLDHSCHKTGEKFLHVSKMPLKCEHREVRGIPLKVAGHSVVETQNSGFYGVNSEEEVGKEEREIT